MAERLWPPLNAGRIESTRGDFQFYIDGVTLSVARLLEVFDRERVTMAAALGIRARTATLSHRYIFEDVPMSLVLIAALGQHYGVAVHGIDSIIRLGCIIHRTDYWRCGRTLDKLGIDRLGVSEITRYVNEGVRD